MTDGPAELRLVRHREVHWILVPSLAIAVFGGAVWIGTVVAGDGDGAGWTTAGLGTAFLAAVGIGIWIVLGFWLRVNERRHAEAVLAEAAVEWPQYSTPAQWSKDVDAVVEGLRADPLQVVGPAAVFSAAVLLIAVVAAVTGETAPALGYGGVALAVVWIGAAATIVVRGALSSRDQRRTRARLSAIEPFPRCWVSAEGAYFEDTGLVRFHQLSEVSVVEPDDVPGHRRALKQAGRVTGMETDLTALDTRLSKSGWALVAVTLDARMTHTFWLRLERFAQNPEHRADWVHTVHVRVPPGEVFRAHELAARIERRWRPAPGALP